MEWSQSPAPAKGRPCRACPQLHASEVRLNGEGWLEDGCQSRPIGVTEMYLFHLECLVKLPISSLSQPSEGFYADPFPLSVTFGTSLASLPASRKCFMSQRHQSHHSTSSMFEFRLLGLVVQIINHTSTIYICLQYLAAIRRTCQICPLLSYGSLYCPARRCSPFETDDLILDP